MEGRLAAALVVLLIGPAMAAAETRVDEEQAEGELARRSRDDAAAERAFLGGTALVAPRGATTLTAQAPIYTFGRVRIDRSLTDRLSIGAGAAGGILDDDGGVGFATFHGKYQLWRGRRAAVAAPRDNAPELILTPQDKADIAAYLRLL